MYLLQYRTLFLMFFAILIIHSCGDDDSYTIPLADNTLLFPNSLLFSVDQDIDTQGEIFFTHQEPAASLIYIGIFSTPPVVIDDELANPEALIWQWQGTRSPGEKIELSEGVVLNDSPMLAPGFFECNMSDYYWAAWAWDNTAQYITHSVTKEQLLSTPSQLPNLTLSSATIIGDTPTDTLLVPGQDVNLRLEFFNDGVSTAKATMITLTQPAITSFPIAIALPDLPPNESTAITVNLTIPSDFSFGDQLNIQIAADYNDCLKYATTITLAVNALNVCLVDVRLIDIRYLPIAIWWDPGALPIFWDPDVYFEFLGPGPTLLHRSMTIEDVTDDWPNTPVLADWPDLTPCINLKLDSTYTINFWDEDFDADDFIGTVSFQAVDYLAEQEQMVTITNDEVIMELYFEWE